VFIATQIFTPLLLIQPVKAANTGFHSPSSTDSPDEWSNEDNAFSDGGGSASANDDKQEQAYDEFNFNIPAGSTIDGIEVALDSRQEGRNCQIQIRLNWNDGDNDDYTSR